MSNKYNFTKTSCEMISPNAVHITKSNCKNGIIAFYTDRYSVAISDNKKYDNVPLMLKIKEYTVPNMNDNPYENWTHFIGKMVKKDSSSKYFVQPATIHFTNGTYNKANKNALDELVLESQRLVRLI